MIVESEKILLDELRGRIDTGKSIIVGVDGKDGTGKSTLSNLISQELSIEIISLDEFLILKNGEYVNSLNIDELRRKIHKLNCTVIIEGVCLLEVAKRLGVTIDTLVYVKTMSPYGTWRHSEECDPIVPASELVKKMDEDLKRFSQFEATMNNFETDKSQEEIALPRLVKEIVYYHESYRPSNKADIVFHIVKN